MNNITNIIIEYKQTYSSKLLDSIFKELNPMLEKKAKFIYYKKYFPLSLYNKCPTCRSCQEQKCRECHLCTCIKGTFNLKEQHLCDLDDVRHDLILETMRMIEKFDITRDFNTYFIATLWKWNPTFINRDMINTIISKSIYIKTEDDKESDIIDTKETKINDFDMTKFLDNLKDNTERKIVHILLKNNKIQQKEIAEKLGFTEGRISQIIKKIKNKIKLLTN